MTAIGDAGEALYTRLLGTPGVATLIGSARVYPGKLPQNPTFPAVSYVHSSDLRQSTFTGPTALPGALYAVDCWGSTYTDARTLAKAVRLALDGVEGWTAGGTTVQVSIVESQQDIYEADVNVHRVSMDVRLFWNEPQS